MELGVAGGADHLLGDRRGLRVGQLLKLRDQPVELLFELVILPAQQLRAFVPPRGARLPRDAAIVYLMEGSGRIAAEGNDENPAVAVEAVDGVLDPRSDPFRIFLREAVGRVDQEKNGLRGGNVREASGMGIRLLR